VLDAFDTTRFERHLASCEVCAVELERLLPAVSALSRVDRATFLPAEQIVRGGELLDNMVNVVAFQRRRARTQRQLAAAASIAVVIVLSIAAGIIGARLGSDRPAAVTAQPSQTTADQTPGGLAEPSPAEPQLRTGTQEVPSAEHFSAIDRASGAHLDVGVDRRPWGTQLSLSLTHVVGPLDCQLYAIDRTGTPTVIATWSVNATGYGTVGNPDPLLVPAATALTRSDLVRLLVRAVAPDGTASELVGVTL
jgi:hypothetical protein